MVDDVVPTAAAAAARSRGLATTIVTADKDMAQAVVDGPAGVCIYDHVRRVQLAEADVRARFGVPPHQVPDFLALTGDAADCIDGACVRGWCVCIYVCIATR